MMHIPVQLELGLIHNFYPFLLSLFLFYSEYRAELYWRLESKRMKALSKENTPFVNEVTPADQNNNVQDEDNKGSNKEVNLDHSREKILFCPCVPAH